MRELKDKTTKELEQLKAESVEAIARIRCHIFQQDNEIAATGVISDPRKVHGRGHAYQCHLRRIRAIDKILLERRKAEKKPKVDKVIRVPAMRWWQQEFQSIRMELMI